MYKETTTTRGLLNEMDRAQTTKKQCQHQTSFDMGNGKRGRPKNTWQQHQQADFKRRIWYQIKGKANEQEL